MATSNPRSRQWRLKNIALAPYDLDVENNTTVGGTLAVTGAAAVTGALTVTGAINSTAPSAYALGTGISAGATQTQAGATLLTKEYNNVTTVATAQDGVRLPSAAAGLTVTVRNSGATVLKVWPFLGDAIDALAADLGVEMAVGAENTFVAIDATTWKSSLKVSLHSPSTQKGSLVIAAADSAGNTTTTITNASQAAARTYTIPDAGASASMVMTEGAATVNGVKTFGNMFKVPINSPVAGAGTVIGDAAALLTGFTVITGANGTVGWILPVTTGGDVVILKGTTAGVAKLWPQSGGQINAVGASTAMSLASGAIPVILISISATQWYTLPLLPS